MNLLQAFAGLCDLARARLQSDGELVAAARVALAPFVEEAGFKGLCDWYGLEDLLESDIGGGGCRTGPVS